MTTSSTLTNGVHHIGLTVSRLEESANFFKEILGWNEVRRDPGYPAIFVSDGKMMITLWQAKSNDPTTFDREQNIGLHHLAIHVEGMELLDEIHRRLADRNIQIEFAPELLRNGPAKHMMCYEPSGIRIEFISTPSSSVTTK